MDQTDSPQFRVNEGTADPPVQGLWEGSPGAAWDRGFGGKSGSSIKGQKLVHLIFYRQEFVNLIQADFVNR